MTRRALTIAVIGTLAGLCFATGLCCFAALDMLQRIDTALYEMQDDQ